MPLTRKLQLWLRRNAENGNAYIECASTLNQRIECWWGYLRRQHVQYWKNKLRQLQEDSEFSGSAVDKSLVQFCFMAILQSELSLAVTMWNNHSIRRCRDSNVPCGQPNGMFNFPELWNIRDYMSFASREEVDACRGQVEFRSTVCCDPVVYDMCSYIMAADNCLPPNTFDEAELVQQRRDRQSVLRGRPAERQRAGPTKRVPGTSGCMTEGGTDKACSGDVWLYDRGRDRQSRAGPTKRVPGTSSFATEGGTKERVAVTSGCMTEGGTDKACSGIVRLGNRGRDRQSVFQGRPAVQQRAGPTKRVPGTSGLATNGETVDVCVTALLK
ncbi:hypothetical protein MAR_027417 [Mya arenaria]|uniref:Integrase core domain-containing protein n=1 Tax=Mya arenaria TaxID=6604 RepID=A0ABY7ETE0_MYAAR|nr:hypothetical protein MAR_027417 [Mya arenaria]